MVDEFVPAEVVKERFARLDDAGRTGTLERAPRARVGRVEEVLVEGPSKKDPNVVSGRTRQNKLVHVGAGRGVAAPGTFADVRDHRGAPHWLRGRRWSRSPTAAPPRRIRIPVTAGWDDAARHPPRARRPDRVGEVGARRWRPPSARRRRDRLDRLDAGLPRHGHRHREADAGRAGARSRTT